MSEIRRLRLPQLIEKTGLKKTAIYTKIKSGSFPPPHKDGRISYWLSTEVDSWIRNGIRQ